MSVLWWLAVLVTLWMSAGNSSAVLDQNKLGPIVKQMLNKYRPSYDGPDKRRWPMFSLAVSIPYNRDKKEFDISKVTDPGNTVKEDILRCEVYTSQTVVAATVLRWPDVLSQCPYESVKWPHVLKKCPREVKTWADVMNKCSDKVCDGQADHAEYRVLQKFNTLVNNLDQEDLLLFYILASPCDQRCTSEHHKWSILKSIKQIKKWKNYAVVFSDVFKPRNGPVIPEENQRESLERLGKQIGLHNIFRCKEQRGTVTCMSCSTRGKVTPYCYSDN